MRVGSSWLVANVRALVLDRQAEGLIVADIDFLGEGDAEKLTGKIYKFRRGVTRYSTTGTKIYPVSSSDMWPIYAVDERTNIEIGTVNPIKDTRGALYVEALLDKN